jgi:hypothetical protein
MTRVVPPPTMPFSKPHTFYAGVRDGRVLMEITAWGEGVNLYCAPPPPCWITHRPPKTAHDNTGWVRRHAPLAARVHAPPPPRTQPDISAIKSQKDLDDLKAGLQSFFLHMRVTSHLLTHWYNWLNTYEIGAILVVYEDVFVADVQCAMTRPEMLELPYGIVLTLMFIFMYTRI